LPKQVKVETNLFVLFVRLYTVHINVQLHTVYSAQIMKQFVYRNHALPFGYQLRNTPASLDHLITARMKRVELFSQETKERMDSITGRA